MNTMEMIEALRAQGVSATLLERVRAWVDEANVLGKVISTESLTSSPATNAFRARPTLLYDGKEIWESAISALLAGEHLLLVGPKATGKNVLAENLATLFGRPSRTISFHINTDAETLIGTDTFLDGKVTFRPGPIYDMAVRGGFGILDEINMARNDAVAVLHATLDFRRLIDLPGYQPIHLSPAARFIATMNEGYLGTRELNEALVSRFVVLRVPMMDEGQTARLLDHQFPTLTDAAREALAGLFADLVKKESQSEISSKAVDLRGLLAALRLIEEGLSPLESLTMGLTNKAFDPFEQELITDTIRLRIPLAWTKKDVFKHED